MIEKIKTLFWFAQRPNHWAGATALVARKFLPNHDAPDCRGRARAWAAEKAVSVEKALMKIGFDIDGDGFPTLSAEFLNDANERAAQSKIRMGGPGDLTLLYAAVMLFDACCVVETGVAYGWSSLAILAGMEGKEDGRLVSVDMPYPKMNNEKFIGIVVPEHYKAHWELIREPDRNGLKKAIAQFGGVIDLCHYDSDKSWYGRRYAYPLLWNALVPGGVFISDDIQDNMAFAEFVGKQNVTFAVTESGGKFVGILRKPAANPLV